ncbi:MAG TPA: hypothetical protein VL443_24400 [Cyclobacteriaceae bacterium]|jgi:hypothetical protein|nr:hypothetical protein [Cyclobacteriaceae bacterium]
MGLGTAVSLISEISKDKNSKALKRQIARAPKYTINDEAYQNKAVAEGQAFGRDRSMMMAQQNLEQDAANAANQAKQVTGSTSGLLSTIAAINANKNTNIRGIAQDEASLQNQKIQQLYNVNNQMIDEKDKAWNYNVNMPYQMKIAALRDKIQSNTEMSAKGLDYETSTSTAFMGSMGSMMGGGA